jgi:hypothetical protein
MNMGCLSIDLCLLEFFFLARTFSSMLNRSDSSRHSCHSLDLSGKVFIFLPLNMTWSFHRCPLLGLRKFPSIPSLLRVFIIKGSWILSSAFYLSIEMNIWLCPLYSECGILHSLIVTWINSTSLLYIIFFIYCWICLASICLRIWGQLLLKPEAYITSLSFC